MKMYNRDRSLNPWSAKSSGAIRPLEKEPPSLYSVCIDRPPGLVNYCRQHLPIDSEFCYRLNTEYVFKVQTCASSSPFAIVQLFSEASELKQLLCFEILISALINVLLKQ